MIRDWLDFLWALFGPRRTYSVSRDLPRWIDRHDPALYDARGRPRTPASHRDEEE